MEQEFNLNELNASTNSTLDYLQREDVSKEQEIRKLSNKTQQCESENITQNFSEKKVQIL
jgi:hypothetical protein